jgi:hypothetical protein
MQTVTPSRANYARSVLAGSGIAVLFVVIAFGRLRGESLMVGVVVIAVTFAVMLGGVFLYFRNTKIDCAPGRITRSNLFGAKTEIGTSDVGTVVLVERLTGATQQPSPSLLLLDEGGKPLLRLRGELWSIDAMGAVGGSMLQTPEVIPEPITTGELRRRHPLSIPLWEAHPVVTSLLAALAIVIAVAVVAFVIA